MNRIGLLFWLALVGSLWFWFISVIIVLTLLTELWRLEQRHTVVRLSQLLWKISSKARRLIKEWLLACKLPDLLKLGCLFWSGYSGQDWGDWVVALFFFVLMSEKKFRCLFQIHNWNHCCNSFCRSLTDHTLLISAEIVVLISFNESAKKLNLF